MPSEGGGWRVPLSDVRLPPEAVAAAGETLEAGWLSSGPRVEAFERGVAELTGSRHGVACSSCTAALQLSLGALGVGPGDEVVMPSLTFVAPANAARLAGARPVFADVVGEDDLTVDPESAAAAIGPRTRALVIVHYAGFTCRPQLLEVAMRAGVPVVEDAAHALGARGEPGACGAWGSVGCFSFFANKNLPLGEGGMLVTGDDELALSARLLRSHGMTSATWERYGSGSADYDVTRAGFNFRLDEPRAAMGSALLAALEELDSARGRAAAAYRERLARVAGLGLPFAERPEAERAAHHLMVVLLPAGADRDAVAGRMAEAGIQTSVHYRPIHLLSAYAETPADLPRTDAIAGRLLTLPLFPHIGESQVDLVCEQLERALSAG